MSLTTNEAVQIATELKNLLSKNSQVLTDPLNPEFQTSNQRWSDEHIKTPAAILKPASEEDTVLIVCRFPSNTKTLALTNTLAQHRPPKQNPIRS